MAVLKRSVSETHSVGIDIARNDCMIDWCGRTGIGYPRATRVEIGVKPGGIRMIIDNIVIRCSDRADETHAVLCIENCKVWYWLVGEPMGSNHRRHRIGKGSELRREAQSYYWVMRRSLGANTRAAHGIMTIDQGVESNGLSRLSVHKTFSLVHNTQLLGDRYAVHHVDHDVMRRWKR